MTSIISDRPTSSVSIVRMPDPVEVSSGPIGEHHLELLKGYRYHSVRTGPEVHVIELPDQEVASTGGPKTGKTTAPSGFRGSEPNMLISSPYTAPEHQLDLQTVDKSCQLMALALTKLEAAVPDYAEAPYETALAWSTVFEELRALTKEHGYVWTQSSFYIVEFRSQLKSAIDNVRLFTLDRESHREAAVSGGLLKYWFGSPDPQRRNLATCVWRNKADAIAGGKGPCHREARNVIPEMYESIHVTGLELIVESDVANWTFRGLG